MTINDFSRLAEDYLIVEKAIASVPDNVLTQTVLYLISDNLRLNDDLIEDLFERWASVSLNRFFQFLTLDHCRGKLVESRSLRLFETSSTSEQSAACCLNVSSVHLETITPQEFKRSGVGMKMTYGFHPTPFGECFLVLSDRGIPYIGFVDSPDHRDIFLNRFRQSWPGSVLSENRAETATLINHIFGTDHSHNSSSLPVLMKGTDFQITVWQALLQIPAGSMASYEDIAAGIGRPKAVRAVGNAVAANPVAYLVPCHRVIGKSGHIHRYGWGPTRKKAMIGWEAAKFSSF